MGEETNLLCKRIPNYIDTKQRKSEKLSEVKGRHDN